MGQTISHRNKKKFGTTIFGYTTTSAPIIYTKIDNQEQQEDNVLFKPFLYGLESTESTHSVTEFQGRTDSGFLLSGKDSQLWKDLIYVDQTYYSDEQQTTINKPEKVQEVLVEDSLTFKDILSTNQNMQEIDLSKRGFGFISASFGLLSMIRKLDLSYNQLKELPEAIGHLQQLENLSVSHNQITFIPDTICHLVHLTDFNLSNNQIKHITPFISHLKGLQTLQLAHNQLEQLTASIESLCNLALLDLSYNPISILPAEITQLPFLRRLRLDGCPFTNSLDQPFPLTHNPPSLLETCARLIIKNEHQILSSVVKNKRQQDRYKSTMSTTTTTTDAASTIEALKSLISDPLYHYLSTFNSCSHCRGPYFESFVKRGRWIERNDIWVPLEYRLCSAHWSDESDRIYAMFSASRPVITKGSETVVTPTSLIKPKPELPILQNPVSKKPSPISIATTTTIPISSLSATTHKSCFNRNQRRSSSITTPSDNIPTTGMLMVSTTTAAVATPQQLQINQEESFIRTDAPTSSSSSAAVKRWRFKVRNNPSLFLKSHRLY